MIAAQKRWVEIVNGVPKKELQFNNAVIIRGSNNGARRRNETGEKPPDPKI